MEAVAVLKKELQPELDTGFLEAVIRAEEENPEDDADALRAIQVALKVVLTNRGVA